MNNSHILWSKVWGIAALQGAITLSWVIYNLYLPILLIQLGLAKELAIALLIIENALEAAIEPIFGHISDRQQYTKGNRIPLITIGVVLSSVLLMVIPSLVILGKVNLAKQLLFLVLVVVWASVMAIFRSPAMALLGRCATPKDLPQAASILTLVGGIIGAFRFDTYGLILQIGAGFAFAIGSVSLLIAGGILRWLYPPEIPAIANYPQPQPLSKTKLGLILITGIFVGWGLRFLIPTVNQILTVLLSQGNSKIAMTIWFIGLGISAIPAGKIATKLGNSLAMIWGCLTIVILTTCLMAIQILSIQYLAIALLFFGFALVQNGAIPYAISLVSVAHSGLGVGMYFGGLNAGISLFSLIVAPTKTTDLTFLTIGTIVSFGLVVVCLLISNPRSYSISKIGD